MKAALLFKKSGETVVLAKDVIEGRYSRNEQFVDPEFKFRVIFVKDSKGHNGPYFRLYLTRDEYHKLSPERKSKYDILCQQRHYAESKWHRDWEDNCAAFCKLEQYIKGPNGTYKRADAFYENGNIVIEFQHSFIDHDFEERNAFYTNLGLHVIWLYDLTMMDVLERDGGYFEILENNAKGFFRISEKQENLKNNNVFVQVSDGRIFGVSELLRKDIKEKNKSTIRLFKPGSEWDAESFLAGIKRGLVKTRFQEVPELLNEAPKSLEELWDSSFDKMFVEDIKKKKQIVVFAGQDGKMMKDNTYPKCVRFSYITFNKETNGVHYNSLGSFYCLGEAQQKEKKWVLLASFSKE